LLTAAASLFWISAASPSATLANDSDHIAAAGGGHEQIVLFQQPELSGVVGEDGRSNLLFPAATHTPLPTDRFFLAVWERNPKRPDGLAVPTKQEMSAKTGLHINAPHSNYQSSFADAGDKVSTAQIYGDAVGAYLNSGDLRNGQPHGRNSDPTFLITPGIQFSAQPPNGPSKQSQVFQDEASSLTMSMELQVPTAVDEGAYSGCSTYVFMDIGFLQKGTKNKISYNIGLFFHDQSWQAGRAKVTTFYDPRSHYFVLGAPLAPDNPYVTVGGGSTPEQGKPWAGFRPFIYKITYDEFGRALEKLAQDFPADSLSRHPEDYVLTDLHLNAEIQYLRCRQPNRPVELGWSMRRQKLVWDRR
jgi:hypothetical protein